jgi:hypothetical protein
MLMSNVMNQSAPRTSWVIAAPRIDCAVRKCTLSTGLGNRRVKNLEGKDLRVEFTRCTHRAWDLGVFAEMLAPVIQGRQEWPEQPRLLSRADFSGESRRR